MNSKFRVAFYLNGRTNKDGKTTILYRICMSGQRLAMGSTGHSVSSNMWSSARARVTGSTSEARFINSELDNIESDLRTIFRKMEFSGTCSLEKIKETYLSKEEQPKEQSFLSFFDYVMTQKEEEIGHGLSLGTVKKYRTARKRFGEYIHNKLKRSDVSFSEINYRLITGFERYLRVDTGVENNTAKGRLKCIRAVLKTAVREGILSDDPSKDVHMSYSPVERGFLPEDEIKKLLDYNFTIKRLEKVRDFFVFSCFTGLAYTDLAALTYNNIVEMDGRMWIVKSREKTGVASNVPLLQIPLDIIEKYRGKAKDNHVFPVMTNQKMNAYLKEIADVCGINKNLTFHLARHTFGTLMVSLGVPFDTVSKMMGHTSMKTTMIYAKITNNKIGEDMDKIAEKLKGLDGSLANMPAKKKNDDADTRNKSAGKSEETLEQQTSYKEEEHVSDTIPAINHAPHDTNAPINVKSIQYVDGKMVITAENGETFVLSSNASQANAQGPTTDQPAPKRGRLKKQAVETSEPAIEQYAADTKVNPMAIPDKVTATTSKTGRPRKSDRQIPLTRKIGRPRKQAVENSSPVVEQQAADTKVTSAAVPDEMPAPSKKRGRPRKAIEQVAPAVEDTAVAPAKKRGRPKKQVAGQTSPVAEEKATSTTWGVGRKNAIQDSPKAKHQRSASVARIARATKPRRRK